MSSPQPNHPEAKRQDADFHEHIKPPPDDAKNTKGKSKEDIGIVQEPVVNPQARTHPLAGPGAMWKGVPLDEEYQRRLDENPDKQLTAGHGNVMDQMVAEAAEAKEQALKDEGWTTREYICSAGARFKRKIQGRRKMVAGKLLKDPKKVEKGRRMVAGEEDYWSDSE